jgi:SAM-dependent methyltransferase
MKQINLQNSDNSKRWEKYFEKTKNAEPRKYLINAIQYVKTKEMALDLGAGTLRDTRFLLEHGFKKVVAVDGEKMFKNFAKEIHNERLEAKVSNFEDFDYQESLYDLINAQYSLPFMKQKYFNDVISKIKKSLKINGIFVGTFFGDKDGWNTKEGKIKNFQTKEEIKSLFADFEILELLEKEEDKPTVNEEIKHWHTFHVTVRKQ